MKQTVLLEKYPVMVAEIDKAETRFHTMEALIGYFREQIDANPKVQFIGLFDHLAHTRRIGGPVAPDIQAAVNLIFCFGYALPGPQVLAVRPRSIGIADMGDRFVISFLEAPMAPANEAMEGWVRALREQAP